MALIKKLQNSLLVAFVAFGAIALQADEVTMKDGTKYEGRITYESDQFVKIEVAISASIKETKMLSRGDIAEIVKAAPDDVEFAKLQNLVPTRSLMSAGAYKTALETGPAAFLRSFPDSKHVEKVKEMEATLKEELDKVERGFIKIEKDWISPQDRQKFQTLVESRILLLRMKGAASSANYNGYIAAMREFEALESNYQGSPAFATAVGLAKQIVPSLGRQLQNMKRDVAYRNAEFEKSKANMEADARAQVEAARAREEQNFQAGLDADKKAGINWVRLNPRSESSLDSYLKFAGEELKKISEYDEEALTAQAEKLVKVDELIAEGNLPRAESLLSEAASMTGKKPSKKKSKSGKPSSYIAALSGKLKEKKTTAAAAEKAEKEAKASEALSEKMKAAEEKENPDLAMPEKEEDSAKEESSTASDFAALAGKKTEPKEKEKASSKKKSSKSTEKKEEKEARPRPPVDEGGGIPGFLFPLIGALLLGVVIVVLKVLGIGGKKEDDGGGDE